MAGKVGYFGILRLYEQRDWKLCLGTSSKRARYFASSEREPSTLLLARESQVLTAKREREPGVFIVRTGV